MKFLCRKSLDNKAITGIVIVFTVLLSMNTAQGQKDPYWDIVQNFKKDVQPYKDAVSWISTMQDDMDKDWSPIMDGGTIRKSLDQAAAFDAIIKQKYPKVENPPWASNWEDKIGSWRKLVESREQIAKQYVGKKMEASLKKKAEQMEKDRENLMSSLGFALPVGFDDRELLHSTVTKEFAPIFASAGLPMPDSAVFGTYDASVDAIVAEAKKQAGNWKWDGTLKDAAAEAKARLWMKTFDPKAEIVKTGMTDAAWQVNKNTLGIPTGRYKRGQVMYKKPGLDQCVVAKFSFEQSYTGGGANSTTGNSGGFTYMLRLQNCN